MTAEWQKYQKQAQQFFQSLGLNARVDLSVEGVRGVYKIDVYVEGSVHGIEFKWVVECKCWNSNVPKEKVIALISIVQDVGSDRGFLLSEKGFQSGAIRAATKSNISLTSIDDLTSIVGDQLREATLSKISWRLHRVRERLRIIKKQKDEYYPIVMEPLGKLAILDLAIEDAVNNTYPNIYKVDGNTRYSANSFEGFIKGADEIIAEAETWIERFYSTNR